jgi:hypothetical protein
MSNRGKTEMDDRSSNKQDIKGGAGITAGRNVTIGDNT